jgi:hypothetical protein
MKAETLNKLSQIVFIVTCVVLVSFASVRVWDDHRVRIAPVNTPLAQVNPLQHGTKLPSIDGVSFERTNATVALVLQSECKFCAASVPTNQKLARMRDGNRLQLVVLSKEPTDVMRAYTRDHALAVDGVASLRGGEIQTPGRRRYSSSPSEVRLTPAGSVS